MTGKPIGSSVRANTTTNRVRRHDFAEPAGESGLSTRVVAEAPPLPAAQPRPAGDLSAATAEEIVRAVGEVFAGRNRNTLADYRHGMRRLLELLQQPAARGRSAGRRPG